MHPSASLPHSLQNTQPYKMSMKELCALHFKLLPEVYTCNSTCNMYSHVTCTCTCVYMYKYVSADQSPLKYWTTTSTMYYVLGITVIWECKI